MTTPEEIRDRLRRKLFERFRFYMSDGEQYDVRHPEMVLLGKTALILGIALDPEQKAFDRAIDIDLVNIVCLEPVVPPQRAVGNNSNS